MEQLETLLLIIIFVLCVAVWTLSHVAKAQKIYTDYWDKEYKQMQEMYLKSLAKPTNNK